MINCTETTPFCTNKFNQGLDEIRIDSLLKGSASKPLVVKSKPTTTGVSSKISRPVSVNLTRATASSKLKIGVRKPTVPTQQLSKASSVTRLRLSKNAASSKTLN